MLMPIVSRALVNSTVLTTFTGTRYLISYLQHSLLSRSQTHFQMIYYATWKLYMMFHLHLFPQCTMLRLRIVN